MNDTPSQTAHNETAHDDGDEHRLILASRVLNTSVFNQDGERIGHVDDLSIERVSGTAKYAIMSFGGFLGIGERFHPLPWSALEYQPDKGGFVVAFDKAALADAPHYDRTELAKLGGERSQVEWNTIYEYYGRYGVFPY
jgi:PRC-barrel domain